jgi:diguanylate cyclase (GGDEF)-like protein/PAS domain S-box-containing protein
MSPIQEKPPLDHDEEVSALVDVLLKTGRRLEELTAGEVDTVFDSDGRAFMLRGTQEQLRRSEVARQAAVLNALPATIALLDINGSIISVNDSWRRYSTTDEMPCGPGHGIGTNYVAVCGNAADLPEAELIAAGIRSVLVGDRTSFSLEYECGPALQRLWFLLTVTPLASDRMNGVVVMQSDITATRQAQEVLRRSDENLRMLVLGVKDYAILLLDSAGRITTWNEGAERINGFRADEIVGEHFSRFYTPEAIAQCLPEQQLRIAAAEGRFEEEGLRVRKNGSRFWANVVISALRDDRGVLRGFATVIRDISDRKQAEANLLSISQRLSLATAIAKVGVWDWELATDVHTWDATMSAMYGFQATDRINYKKWSSSVYAEDLPRVEAELRRTIKEKREGSGDFRIVVGNGTVKNISFAEKVVLDQSANVVRVIGVNVDITERRAAEMALRQSEERMKHLAAHDFLTGLPNRMLLNDRIGRAIELARRNRKKAAVLFLDMDGFKHINDSLGHPTGDMLLQAIGKRLLDCVRASDTVSRQGGDEFIVLLPEVQRPQDTVAAANRMLEAVASVHSIFEHDLQVTCCIGASVYPDDGHDAETLIKNADTALYQAKENGHSSCQLFDSAMNVRAVERQFIEQSLRRALARHEFELHYQPIVNLKTWAITGAEALIRWNHPTRGLISPAQFIAIAEDSGLILPIGTWVIEEACRQVREWMDAGLPELTMSVNVSGLQFQSGNFVGSLSAILLDIGLDPRVLELEVTESLLMKRPDFAASILRAVREKGVRVAIDDFGTGYSSLSYLTKLPLDTLKIDQSFVRQITTTPNETSIVTAIIGMGQSLKLRVVAEGVETPQELDFLVAHHCDDAQGYYFSRPVPPAEFVNLFHQAHPWMRPVSANAI